VNPLAPAPFSDQQVMLGALVLRCGDLAEKAEGEFTEEDEEATVALAEQAATRSASSAASTGRPPWASRAARPDPVTAAM
jgi:hypothetical protein